MKKHNSVSRIILYSLLALALTASISLWVGCSEESGIADVSSQSNQLTLLNEENPRVQAVTRIQDLSTEALFSHPDVVGTGTGLDDNGNPTVVVYTTEEVTQYGSMSVEQLQTSKALGAIPESIEGLPVKVKVTGKFVVYADPTARFSRPVPIGVSTGHPDITAGTIGCRVIDGSGNVYALSNNHVYANINSASIGDNVLQPGPTDGGTDPADAIGTLYDYEYIEMGGAYNYIDAAIAAVTTSTVGYSTPSGDGYGTPSSSIKSATIGMKVQKYGRTTGWTFGEVAELNVTVNVCYVPRGPFSCAEYATMTDQIGITPGTFSAGGDSGSLIVTDDGNKNPVGLLFAGSSDRTLANRIDLVLNRFNVTVDDGSGGGPTNNPPTADFTYTTSELTAYFTDQSTDSDGSIASWNWNFGDGSTSTAQNPSHTYGTDGTYTVSLTVTDNDGATDNTSQSVTVSGSTTNNPPTADFTYTTSDLTAYFTDQSTDSDGSIASWNWNFGDGSSSTAQNPSHAYGTDGTYTVSLTVTDNDGATDNTSQSVTVSSGGTGGITLSVVGYKVRGVKHADLTWSGADGTDVEIYRDGTLIATTTNDGSYTDNSGQRGGGSFTYKVCEIGGSVCSNQVTVTY